jgi:hypothetical protein
MKYVFFITLMLLPLFALAKPKFLEDDLVTVINYKFSDQELFYRCDKVSVWKVVSLFDNPGKEEYRVTPEAYAFCTGRVIIVSADQLQAKNDKN